LEYVLDQAGLLAVDAACTTSLAEILAREARGEHLDIRQFPQLRHVFCELDPEEVVGQHPPGCGIDLAQELGRVPSPVEAELDAADSREEAGHGQPTTFAWPGKAVTRIGSVQRRRGGREWELSVVFHRILRYAWLPDYTGRPWLVGKGLCPIGNAAPFHADLLDPIHLMTK
jgi:hypothetical protein